MKLERMWINQPSTKQLYHSLHGVKVLATVDCSEDKMITIYFVSGPIVSRRMHKDALSPGWPE